VEIVIKERAVSRKDVLECRDVRQRRRTVCVLLNINK